jgi:hypothetical protein
LNSICLPKAQNRRYRRSPSAEERQARAVERALTESAHDLACWFATHASAAFLSELTQLGTELEHAGEDWSGLFLSELVGTL